MQEQTVEELRELLLGSRRITDELLARLEEHDLQPSEVISLLESFALVERRLAPIVEQLRTATSQQRQREEERSIRQFVLGALQEIGVPQTAGFLEDYLYASDLVVLKTRGLGALRRDEYRAWDRQRRNGRPRLAYVVPCLDESGSPVARWMARSDWPLRERLLVPGAEELWEAHRLRALIDGHGEAADDGDVLFLPLIERYAGELFEDGTELGALDSEGLERLRAKAEKRIATQERAVSQARDRTARRFEKWDEPTRLWGKADR
ncbi:MAG: hypothetical protein M3P00_11415 [Gemmatimonadota bacterium]|nr:hypothetical protein [Gemmatimonadota bacterium]